MKTKSAWLTAILLGILSGGPIALADPPAGAPAGELPGSASKDEDEIRRQLGERFFDLALSFANATNRSKSTLKESGALIEAATRMNPTEPRFWRLLAGVRDMLGDSDGAIDAWTNYLKIDSCRDDEVAQITIIDLYLSQMQAADVKLKYIKVLLAKPTLSARVKAHVAARAVPLLDQRSHTEALAMLAEGRNYYPLPEITQLELQMRPADATPPQMLKLLLNVVRANPSRADVVLAVAELLASTGFSDESLVWYGALMEIYGAQGAVPPPEIKLNYLVERFRTGEAAFVADQLDAALRQYPEIKVAEGTEDELTLLQTVKTIWSVRLILARSDENPVMLKKAQQVFLRDTNLICNAILSGSYPAPASQPSPATPVRAPVAATGPAATQPADQPAPQYAKAVQTVQKLTDPRFKTQLIASLTQLAWFELYYDHDPQLAAPIVDALKQLVPADNVELRRLMGWLAMLPGDEAGMKAARDIFTEQMARDPLSMLGLFRLEDKTTNHNIEAAAIGAKIASDFRSGLLGAILFEAIKGRGFKAAPRPDAAPIKDELGKFPKDWLQAVHNPSRFYSVRVEPINVSHQLGDPMLATVTVENNCLIDLTIGDYGLLKPDVIFDAQINGANAKNFPAVTQDRLTGRQVLGAGESISQVVRIDHGEMGDALRANPAVALYVSANIVTNPVVVGPSHVAAGAGGFVERFSKTFARTQAALATDQDRRALFQKMSVAAPVEKMLGVELMAACINYYLRSGAPNEQRDLAAQLVDEIERYRADASPYVKLWASYMFAVLSNTNIAAERRAIGDMLQATDWHRRMLGLAVSRRYLSPEEARANAIRQEKDDDALVKRYAAAMAESLQTPTTQPATIPADK